MAIRYEVDSTAVRIYDTNDVCFVEQLFHPDGRDWNGTKEMEDWAKDFVANHGKTPAPSPIIIPDTKTIIDLGE